MPTAKNGFQILNIYTHRKKYISKIKIPFFNAYKLKINPKILKLERVSGVSSPDIMATSRVRKLCLIPDSYILYLSNTLFS